MEAMILDRPFAERLMDGITEIYIESVERYLDQVGPYIDVFTFWDDVCTQDGWMISPDLYVSLVSPASAGSSRRSSGRRRPSSSTTAAAPSFDPRSPPHRDRGRHPQHPVQVSARGMDSRRLKGAYGKDITFWGGGVDTQRVLPFGTEAEVRDEVRRRIDDFAPGGGFVYATVQTSRPSSRRPTS